MVKELSKSEMRTEVVRARHKNPCATLQSIGNTFGVSRERIRQILSEEGETTRHYVQTYLCNECGKDLGRNPKRRFCSHECHHKYTHIEIACSYCGNLKEYNLKWLIWQIEHYRRSTDHFFCSNGCKGRWLGNTHGFGINLKNQRYGVSFKYDREQIFKLIKQGFGNKEISQLMNIPLNSRSVISVARKLLKDEK